MTKYLLAAGVIASLFLGLAFKLYVANSEIGALKLKLSEQSEEYAKANLKVLELAYRQTQEMQSEKDRAIQNADKRAKKLAARLELSDRNLRMLHSSADNAAVNAGTSHEACIKTTEAFRAVFGECSKAYSKMGAIAEGHLSDVQTLEEAWPVIKKESNGNP